MATTTINDLWTPDIWVQEMRERQATFPTLLNSGSVVKTAKAKEIAAGPGVAAEMPFFKDISDQDDEIQVENNGPSENILTAGQMLCAILNRVCKTSTSALAGAVSGTDPVGEILAQLLARRNKQRHKTILAILRGIFGSYGAKDGVGELAALRVDRFGEKGSDATADETMGVDMFIDAKSLMGELSEDLRNGAMFIHTTPLAALEKADVTAFKEKSMGAFTIRTYREIPIFTSESLVRAGDTDGYVYETYLLSNGVLAHGEKDQLGDVLDVASLQLDIDKDKNDGFVYDRTRFTIHPTGMRFTGTPAGQSATNAELATVGNWDLKYSSANRCGMVCIRTNA